MVIGGRDHTIELDISRISNELVGYIYYLYVLNIGLVFACVSFNIYA